MKAFITSLLASADVVAIALEATLVSADAVGIAIEASEAVSRGSWNKVYCSSLQARGTCQTVSWTTSFIRYKTFCTISGLTT